VDPINSLKILRDKGLEALKIPLPERTFAQAMTGGAANGGISTLPVSVLRDIKQAWANKPMRMAEMKSQLRLAEQRFARDPSDANRTMRDAMKRFHDYGAKADTGNMVSGYSSGRDTRMTLGSFGVYFDKSGGVLIKDTWKVDSPADIHEGGASALKIYNAANRLGTYRPVPIEVRLTKAQWDKL
jgi:hypothetical protein